MWAAINITADSSKVTLVCDDYNDGEILQLDKSQVKCKVDSMPEEQMYQNLSFVESMCDFDKKVDQSPLLRANSLEDLPEHNETGC